MRPAMTIRHTVTALATCMLALGLPGCTTCSKNESETKATQAQSAKTKRPGKKPRRPEERAENRRVQVGEGTRRYLFLRSRVTNAKTPAPVLVMLHDNGGSARDITGRRDLMGGASKLGFLVAAPIANKEGWGPGLCTSTTEAEKPGATAQATKAKPAVPKPQVAAKGANDAKTAKDAKGQADAAAAASAPAPGSDVDYIKAVLADLGGIGADPKRIYLVATGGAAGFAERLIAELPGQFAGVSLFAPEDCKQKDLKAAAGPVPTLIVTGAQPAATEAGAPAAPAPAAATKAASIPGLDYWLKANTCDAKPQPSGDAGVQEERYSCKTAPVVHVNLQVDAKRWPRKIGSKWTIRYMMEFFNAAAKS
jgi:poly(3-hydroxybutyrate) depolymerase